MRQKLRNMGVRITELSEIMDISRPTLYKFIDMYDDGEREKIDQRVLKLLDHIKRNPRLSKRDVLHYVLLIQGGRENAAGYRKIPSMVTVTAVERPVRKILILRSRKATDYLSYCDEKGCDWTDVQNAIAGRFDDPAIITLPQSLVVPGTSDIASGVEVPADYSGEIPEGYDVIDLQPCTMLFFEGSPYDNEDDFCEAIDIVSEALDAYDPERFGWKFDPAAGPAFNFGSYADKGTRMAVPVGKIKGKM